MIAIGAAATAALTAAASFNPADKLPSVILGVLAAIAAFLAIKHYRLWKDTVDIRKRLDILTTEKDFRSSGIVNVHYEFPTEEIKREFRASRRKCQNS